MHASEIIGIIGIVVGLGSTIICALIYRNTQLQDKSIEDLKTTVTTHKTDLTFAIEKQKIDLTNAITTQGEAIQNQLDNHEANLKLHSEQITRLQTEAARCKVDCTQTFTSNEAFVREAGFMRRTIEAHTQILAEVKGTLQIVNRMPEISGQIAQSIVREMRSKE